MKNLTALSFAGAALACAVALPHCSSSSFAPNENVADASVSGEAGSGDGGDGADAPASDAKVAVDGGDPHAGPPPGPAAEESEPNGGEFDDAGVPRTNAMTTPGTMTGAIDPADDADLFTLKLSPGELWYWRVGSEGSSLYTPHLAVFDTAANNLNPTQIVRGGVSGGEVSLQHFVLRPGKFAAAVRDARNVPSSSSQHVGDAQTKYVLYAYKDTPSPTTVTLPQTVTGALTKVSAVALYSFKATKNQNVEIVLRAARRQPASELDSRMSLFNATSKTAVLTNDNAGASKDSEIRGPMPADAEYWIIVENEADMVFGASASALPDLSFEIDFNLK